MTRIKRHWILVVLVVGLLAVSVMPVFGADSALLKACALDQSSGTPASLAGWLMETIASGAANC